MPLPNERLPDLRSRGEGATDDERREFCRRLKQLRERKGLSLAAIAEQTKIRASLFAALERNDLRTWPKAIYRRAYFREYARQLDAPLDEMCDEFNRLFTDEPVPAKPAATPPPAGAAPPEDLRLVLDTGWHGPRAALISRLAAALVDAVIVGVVSGAMMLIAGIDAAVSVAAVTMAYFSLSTVLFGETPAHWIIAKRDALGAVFGRPETPAPPHQEEPESRAWVSDATRVGPAPPPQLRVRFKV